MAPRVCVGFLELWLLAHLIIVVRCLALRFPSSSVSSLPFNPPCEVARAEIVFPSLEEATLSPGGPTHRAPAPLTILLPWRRLHRRLRLFPSDVSAGGLAVLFEDRLGNATVMATGEEAATRCHFQGFLEKDKSSYAAVSVCDGLTGYIQTDRELLFLEPATSHKEGTKNRPLDNIPHVIYTCQEKDSPLSNGNYSDAPEPVAPEAEMPPRRRKRSAGRKRYLEVQLAVDHTVVNMHGKQRVINYVMTLMNIANSVYQHHTLGVNLRVVVTEIILLDEEQQKDVLIKRDAYRTVQRFCQWSSTRQSPAHGIRHDIAVLLTREGLGPAGYAPITGLCNPSRACAAITDEGFTSGFIIAHEMAHVFGLFHDGHGNHCTGRSYTTAIMAPLVEAKLNHFWWSECSKAQMQQVINYLFCLNDDPNYMEGVKHYELDTGPEFADDLGKAWSLDFQCRLEFGDRFGICAAFPTEACTMLWCSERTTPHLCRTKRGPPMPGSSCGREMECRQRQCVYVGNEKPVHGGWTSWASWGECSVDCGVGIKRRRRHCSSPKPAYGGRDCSGDSEDWDTCLSKDCDNYYDARAGHCAVWNDMRVRDGEHDWQPYQTSKASERCKQTCVSSTTREVMTLDVEVSDGTPCDYDHPTNICYLGQCLVVGCDGVRNSTQEFDSCGVCGGDDSTCKTVSGHYTKVPEAGQEYVSVVFFPKGSRNMEVVKRGKTAHFLALREPDYGRYVLNGNKKREASREFVLAGARFVYSSKFGFQSLTSRGPVYSNLEVMLFPDKDLSPASVTYEYSVGKDDHTLERRKYAWRFKEWSQCSVTCGEGVTTITHECYDKETGQTVGEEACRHVTAPRQDRAACAFEPCSRVKYIWAMTNEWSDCSAPQCGQPGVERQGYKCQRYHMDNDTYSDVQQDLCDADSAPSELRDCTAPPCELQWTLGKWSQCSETCGKGRQTRVVYCGDPDTDSDDIWCKDVPPPLSQGCQLEACQDKPSADECRDKYRFCASAHGLDLKCRSRRFASMCCSSCQDVLSGAARSPRSSHWDMYRQQLTVSNSQP